MIDRRTWLKSIGAVGAASCVTGSPTILLGEGRDKEWKEGIKKGLDWVARTQSRIGNWSAQNQSYPVAMTALAGMALICSGSTTTQGPYAANVRRTTDYLMSRCRGNGLIGDENDNHYTYGHGFSMLFLSQVLGEEEDEDRRGELVDVLTKAVEFSVFAQTKSGGWGYVSARDGGGFDEGSTTITQVQGLRGCRNAGIVVPKESIESAKEYIYGCKNPDGGISYSSRNRGTSRPAITAAALAALFNAGDYDSKHIPEMLDYCKKELHHLNNSGFGHWFYTYLYYSQVVYRQGAEQWNDYRDKIYARLLKQQKADGTWEGEIGPIYTTSVALTILQLDRGLIPIYQK